MKTQITIIIALFLQLIQSQNKEISNAKGNLYFGANIGLNNIGESTTFILSETNYTKKAFQGGIFAEYYFAKQWSLTSKISYFETGLNYYYHSPGTSGSSGFGGFFNYGSASSTSSANFSGQVLASSLQIKWEFRLIKDFKGYLKVGVGYYIETHSNYKNYFGDVNNGNYPTTYAGGISGIGFTYFLNDKYSIFAETEYHAGSTKYNSGESWLGNGDRQASNQLLSLGIKYKFKSFKNEKTN